MCLVYSIKVLINETKKVAQNYNFITILYRNEYFIDIDYAFIALLYFSHFFYSSTIFNDISQICSKNKFH